ncbi:MAG TPA: TerC family protein [Pseudonocardiaceae bacterium]|nr:TerC family protein [Pseudonocardiaceae bacterium]
MNVPLWVWVATGVGLAIPVTIDVWRARRPHPVGFGEAVTWSVVYIGLALLFGVGVLLFGGPTPSVEFFTGFVVEKTLSVDNLFVFALVLGAFAVPARDQSRVLLIGILGALAMRAVFIVAGAAALQRFTVLFLAFGILLLYTAVHLLRSHGKPPDVRNGRVVRWVGNRFAISGLGLATVAILSVDVMFALDSIPAIFGITQNLYLVLCTNAFALLGLRALYFVLAGLLDRLVHLHYGLSIVLGLIGVKLVLHYLHSLLPGVPEIPTWLSLVLIVAVFTVTTVTSLRARPTSRPTARETSSAGRLSG